MTGQFLTETGYAYPKTIGGWLILFAAVHCALGAEPLNVNGVGGQGLASEQLPVNSASAKP